MVNTEIRLIIFFAAKDGEAQIATLCEINLGLSAIPFPFKSLPFLKEKLELTSLANHSPPSQTALPFLPFLLQPVHFTWLPAIPALFTEVTENFLAKFR